MAQRYGCVHASNPAAGQSSFHSKGNGKPRSKWCTYCHGEFWTETGKWGVFVWNYNRSAYKRADAVKLFEVENAAHRFAEAGAHDNLCVRWSPDVVI
jgi:hypothetical protein